MIQFTQEHADTIKETNKSVVRHEVILTNVCKKLDKILSNVDELFEKFSNQIIDQQKECMKHRTEIASNYVKSKTFYFVIAILVIGYIGKMFLL